MTFLLRYFSWQTNKSPHPHKFIQEWNKGCKGFWRPEMKKIHFSTFPRIHVFLVKRDRLLKTISGIRMKSLQVNLLSEPIFHSFAFRYFCDICQFSTFAKTKLTQHKKKVHRFECGQCSSTFTTVREKNQHEKDHLVKYITDSPAKKIKRKK